MSTAQTRKRPAPKKSRAVEVVAPTPTIDPAAIPYEVIMADDQRHVLDQLARGQFTALPLYELSGRAARLALVQGFDQLLSLPQVSFTPYPYQLETAQMALRRFRGRALLCDEVGLGKTIEAGLVLKEYLLRGLVRKILILTPPALVSQWREEMSQKFGLDFVTNEDPEFAALGPAAWSRFEQLIVSLHTARRAEHSQAILQQRYDLVIVDEAHHLKSRNTATWRFVNELDKKFILLLTATPVQNDLEELFNLITILKPGQLKTMRSFKKEFVVRGDPRQPKNRARLQELLFDVMVRNTRSQVGLKLPPRHATTVRLALSPAERELYDAVSDFVRTEHPRVGRGDQGVNRFVLESIQMEIGSSSFAVQPTLAALAANPHNAAHHRRLAELIALARAVKENAKARALLQVLRATREKVLVFTRYLETLRHLEGLFKQTGISYVTYHGGMPTAAKNESIARFETERQVLLASEAAGEGRNLQFCNTMVNYDLPWNPMRIEQRVGRIHRIGQEREVYIYNLAAEGTVEDYLIWLLDSKINMFELVVGEMDMILGNLADDRDFADIVADIWLRSRSPEEAQQGFAALAEELARAKQEYLRTQEYDRQIFGQDYTAE